MTGIQALEHKNPVLPMRPGKPEGIEFEYIRHGTTTLISNFDIVSGKILKPFLARHRNRWVSLGTGSAPNAWYNAIIRHFSVLNPYAFFIVTFILLFRPSTTPLDIVPLALNQLRINGLWHLIIFAIFFIGIIFESITLLVHRSINFPAQVGETYDHNPSKSSFSR